MSPPEAQPSANMPPRSKPMTLVGERNLPDPPQPQTVPPSQTLASVISGATTSQTISPEVMHRAAWKGAVLGTLSVISAVLAARLILLVGVCGAIALAYLTTQQPDPFRLGALGIYAAVVVIPLVWLAARR